jgi:hypothetical protein
MPSLELLRRRSAKDRRKIDEALRALDDIRNKDGKPEAVAEIALDNIAQIERNRER